MTPMQHASLPMTPPRDKDFAALTTVLAVVAIVGLPLLTEWRAEAGRRLRPEADSASGAS